VVPLDPRGHAAHAWLVTVRELLQWAGGYPWLLLALCAAPPLLVALIGRIHGRGGGGRAPWKYLYSAAVYVASVPGTLAAVLAGYTLFMLRESFLDVNLLVYGLPIISMVVTLALTSRTVEFDQIPGFDRLSGLIVLLTLTFVIVLFVAKTRIWIVFGGSLIALVVTALVVFGLLKWASFTLFRGRRDPRRRPPAPL
jgi:hypothetical protein